MYIVKYDITDSQGVKHYGIEEEYDDYEEALGVANILKGSDSCSNIQVIGVDGNE